jgi:hypothetical protein
MITTELTRQPTLPPTADVASLLAESNCTVSCRRPLDR